MFHSCRLSLVLMSRFLLVKFVLNAGQIPRRLDGLQPVVFLVPQRPEVDTVECSYL